MLRISTIKIRRGLSEISEVEKRYTRFSGVDFVSSPTLYYIGYKSGDIPLNGYNMNNRTMAEYVK